LVGSRVCFDFIESKQTLDSLVFRAFYRKTGFHFSETRSSGLPPLVLFCDDERLPEPLAAIGALPRGAMVVVRARDDTRRATLAAAACGIARGRALTILIAGDNALAKSLRCGLHLPEAHAGEIPHWRAASPLPITVAAHSLRAVIRGFHFGADAAFLSPVFATQSHPGAPPLGAIRAALIARATALPVYALGGIDAQTVLRLSGFAGLAAIGALRL